ncbi:solute carrier family 13 member 2 isoform X2 [Choloepus didactylus]|nr:solute carrier family 13 member 2 isoform X2 [Choloepus didactylus]XP_037665961.1 solute carrier family 13 member 2 isoform X2 [Choloepus didactylus]
MMGIMDASEVCIEYMKDTNILFLGGLLVAITVEHWNLHKRIALRVLLTIGVRPALLILGFMVVTAFLSMWISNTATTAMMVPIAHAVLEQLHNTTAGRDVEEGGDNPAFELQEPSPQKEVTKLDNSQKLPVPPVPSEPRAHQNQQQLRFTRGMSLCVCYSASIGGIATLTGTTPNLVLQGQVNSLFPDNGNVVNFASWFGFAFPTMILLLLLAWLWLQILFLGFNFRKNFGIGGQEQEQERAAFHVIQTEHKLLGPMSFAEKAVSILFFILVLLWFTREPGFFPGWGNLAFSNDKGKSMVSDGTVAMVISMILFIMPSKIPGLTQDPGNPEKLKAPPTLLSWKTVHAKMPWGIVILLGGGFALAKGSEHSGLSDWLGYKLTPLQHVPAPAIAFILCLLVATFTECTSNVATTTLFLPILASMAQAICLHPLYIMLPCTLASSLAFMLPVATPPNAIVFSFGGVKVSDMAQAGFLLNVIGVLVITLAINSWGIPIFSLYSFPSWAISNTTAQCLPPHALPSTTLQP